MSRPTALITAVLVTLMAITPGVAADLDRGCPAT
jgi:hypothetical protein